MKSLIYIAILLFSINTVAQKPAKDRGMRQNFTPEQQAELQTKRMALNLDLSQKQIAEIKKLQLKRVGERKTNRALRDNQRGTGNRPTQEEMFTRNTKRLDTQLEHQKELRKILSEQQYSKWEKLKDERNMYKSSRKINKGAKNAKRGKGSKRTKGRKQY